MASRLRTALCYLLLLPFLPHLASSQSTTSSLDNARQPALYTGDFGDCLGTSLINVTRFNAAYYRDNATVLFHLAGNTALISEAIMMYIDIYAYGTSHFDLAIDPCRAGIGSLCPLQSATPVEATAIIDVQVDSSLARMSSVAFTVPDFEGEAILRIFANTTQSEIGCFSAVMTNGRTMSHPKAIGSVLGILTFVAFVASIATAIYGTSIPVIRRHYSHSISVGVVFAVWQHIYITGALSVNWAPALSAWWNNFAWASGMIYSNSMQHSINDLIGTSFGNTSQVGAAPVDSSASSGLGGGYDISLIYRRGLSPTLSSATRGYTFLRDVTSEIYESVQTSQYGSDHALLLPRAAEGHSGAINTSEGFGWYGRPASLGLPLPGNYSGFAGTLTQQRIPASNAFMTGFLWLLVLIAFVVAAILLLKAVLEGLIRVNALRPSQFRIFRMSWVRYTVAILLRTLLLAWFLIMFLTIFQFTYESNAGVRAVAAVVFCICIAGFGTIAAYAVVYKRTVVNSGSTASRLRLKRKSLRWGFPWFALNKDIGVDGRRFDEKSSNRLFSRFKRDQGSDMAASRAEHGTLANVHDHDSFTKNFAWLAGRYRASRWWFFTAWLSYEFIRAGFYAGASGSAVVQLFGLLIVEVLAFAFMIWARPFEGKRLNALVVYSLSISKILSVAFAVPFDTRFDTDRVTTTVIAFVIIIIQGLLTLLTILAILIGCVTTCFSLSRNSEQQLRPARLNNARTRYLQRMGGPGGKTKMDGTMGKLCDSTAEETPDLESQSGFEVKGMKRVGKIADSKPRQLGAWDDDNIEFPMSIAQVLAAADEQEKRDRERADTLEKLGSSRGFWPAEASSTPVPTEDAIDSFASRTNSLEERGENSKFADSISAFFNKRNNLSAPELQPMVDSSQLRVGEAGDTSTRDSIGAVPMPTMRVRASSVGSNRPRSLSRGNTPGSSAFYGVEAGTHSRESQMHSAGPSSRRTSRAVRSSLEPTKECDEIEEDGET